MLATYAKDVNSDMLYKYALSKEAWPAKGDYYHVYRGYKYLCMPALPSGESFAPLKVYFPDLQVAAIRESKVSEQGLYVAIKGGHNDESHNHNDLGSIIVYSDGKPLFIDVGSGTYTKRTFSSERYTIWTMNSDYHNTLNFGDTVQINSKDYYAVIKNYCEENGKMTLDLVNAYPAESGLASYERSAALENGVITLVDRYELNEAKNAFFSFMTLCMPERVGEGEFIINGRKVSYDPALIYSIEEVPCDTPETNNIPGKWNTEKIYRIRLTTPISKIGDYTLTIQ